MKVIKLGGSLLDDASRRAAALAKIVSRWTAGEELVLEVESTLSHGRSLT